jgi:diguanylate cyclase (GGDEF)-like protein
MHLNLIRYILISFLVTAGVFIVSGLTALSTLQQVADQFPVSNVSHMQEMIRNSQGLVMFLCLVGLVSGLIAMVLAVHQVSKVMDRLRRATKHLSDVVLDEMTPGEFLSASDGLDEEIQEMMLKIKDSQQRYLDASPLTRLPGNMAIEQVLQGKMERGEKFALCYIDLDDFKAYNDRYGYAKGSDLIKMTGEVLYRAKDEYAETQDFVGHIGGDDFVLITSPDIVEQVCKAIISEFDSLISDYYHADDVEKGFIEGTDRYGVKRRFSVMSISIAVVSDVKRSFTSPIEIAKVATEIKDYVKSLPGSNYLMDRRVKTRCDS